MTRPFVVAALCFFAFWTMVADVWGHSWYPRECCSDKDCAPIDASRVRLTNSGYMIDEKFHVEFKGAKLSPDEHYHACFPGRGLQLGCFWAPRGTG